MIYITEVGPRDGLQNEDKIIPTEDKVRFIDLLSKSGVNEIEVSSFVSPKWVPQLSDASDLFRKIKRQQGVCYSALVPNQKGFERAIEAKPDRIAVFAATTESFSQKNTKGSIAEILERCSEVVKLSQASHIPVRGYVSTVFSCPYEGHVEPRQSLDIILRLIDMGCDFVALGDTLGTASMDEVREVLDLLLPRVGPEVLVMHLHDTFGRAKDNIRVSLEYGLTRFDSSAGGLGGCPFAGSGASGNVSTQSLVECLKDGGYHCDVDAAKVASAWEFIRGVLTPKGASHNA
jgi:hydroxymethylglutaryl-CoA lyase